MPIARCLQSIAAVPGAVLAAALLLRSGLPVAYWPLAVIAAAVAAVIVRALARAVMTRGRQ